MRNMLAALAMVVALGACQEQRAAMPQPQEPGPDAVGTICHMALAEHAGPKGQVFVTGEGEGRPLWFSSVRDTFTWLLVDEGLGKSVAAVWVNDMGKARDWSKPEAGAWVDARKAVYVVGSDKDAGMGGAELVPFADKAAAERFAHSHGGVVMPYAAVSRETLAVSAAPIHTASHHHE